MILHELVQHGKIHPPKWLPDNTQMLGYAGSAAYGVSNDTSDMDCFGFCIPPKEIVFPFTDGGRIYGFGTQEQRFRVWSEHHVVVPDQKRVMDFAIYNIVDFFHLAMENNPNILDVLFLPRRCILHTTKIAEHVRENRRLFLHKGAMAKLRGYAYSGLNKLKGKHTICEFLKLCEKYQLPLDIELEDVENEIKKREANKRDATISNRPESKCSADS